MDVVRKNRAVNVQHPPHFNPCQLHAVDNFLGSVTAAPQPNGCTYVFVCLLSSHAALDWLQHSQQKEIQEKRLSLCFNQCSSSFISSLLISCPLPSPPKLKEWVRQHSGYLLRNCKFQLDFQIHYCTYVQNSFIAH